MRRFFDYDFDGLKLSEEGALDSTSSQAINIFAVQNETAVPFFYTPLFANIDGTPGDDVLDGTADADTINGFAGNDIINGLGGDDTLNGGGGDD